MRSRLSFGQDNKQSLRSKGVTDTVQLRKEILEMTSHIGKLDSISSFGTLPDGEECTNDDAKSILLEASKATESFHHLFTCCKTHLNMKRKSAGTGSVGDDDE